MKKTKHSHPVKTSLLQFWHRCFSGKSIQSLFRTGVFLTGLMTMIVFQLYSQDLDVPYVPTPNDVVEEMLDIADVGPGDYVIDLGSGDGRIVIAAAERGATGHGIDLNPERVSEARENAQSAGVTDRLLFLEGNIFETDFSKASVITMYLLSSVNEELRPSLLENLRPGTRVVSHSFDMGDWKPDDATRVENHDIYLWIIPARLGENWQWETNGEQFSMAAKQEYQEVNVIMRIGNRTLITEEATLRGDRITLIVHDEESDTRYIYSGFIENDTISGTVQVHGSDPTHIEEWSATLEEQ